MFHTGSWRLRGRELSLVLIAGVIFLTLLIFLLRPSAEPMYEGKPFSYWLDQLPITMLQSVGESRMFPATFPPGSTSAQLIAVQQRYFSSYEMAVRAVDKVGEKNLPMLAERLRYKESRLKSSIQFYAWKLHILRPPSRIDGQERGQALTALMQLGSRARPIAPQLVTMANDRDPDIRAAARHALYRVAPDELAKLDQK